MKRRLPWFKHYANAGQGETLQLIKDKLGFEGVGFYWSVLELVARYEDRDNAPGRCTISWRMLERESSNTIRKVSLIRLLSIAAPLANWRCSAPNDDLIEIHIPNWLEFQETRGGKRIAKKTKVEGEGRREKGDIDLDPPKPPLLDLWNQNCGNLPRAEQLNKQRDNAWRLRWKAKPDRAYWVDLIQRLAASSFATGNNDRSWRADIDFFLRETTAAKILEGKYDDRGNPKSKPQFSFSAEDFRRV